MYIIRNALKSINRSKVRNILIGIIALVIAISACIALSIKEAAIKTKEDTLAGLSISANISFDRTKQMQKMREQTTGQSDDGGFDKSAAKEMFASDTSLSLTELQKYSEADSVSGFYYTMSASLDASDSFEAIDTTGGTSNSASSSEATTSSNTDSYASKGANADIPDNQPSGMGGGMGRMGTQGDFSIIGASDDTALTDFGENGSCSITSGEMFAEGTSDNDCVITQELATYNSVEIGDKITLTNPNDEDETVSLTVVGIYTNSAADNDEMSGFSAANDSANKIYMSYTALKAIADKSETAHSQTDSDEETTTTTTSKIATQLIGTYVFADADAYEQFTVDVYTLGLSDDYTVSSSDLTAFEQSLQPLENLSTFATYFLLVVFAIGAIILVVINVFNIRERKYEIGVLTAIGMKKHKVALQFVTELFAVTLAAIIIGAGIGAATSVPVTNALLSAQIESNQSQNENVKQNFGRDTNMAGEMPLNKDFAMQQDESGADSVGSPTANVGNFVSSISYSTNLTVLLELIAVGILLTLISSLVSVLFIMRYEPLKILSNRE